MNLSLLHNDEYTEKVLNSIKEAFSWQSIIYICLFAVSLVLLIIYVAKWQKTFSPYITVLFILIPIDILGTYFMSVSATASEALICMKVIYAGGCFLTYLITMVIMDLCHFHLSKTSKILLLMPFIAVFLSVITTEFTGLFYRSFHVEKVNGGVALMKDYGFMHTVSVALILIFFGVGFFGVLFALFRKNVPRKRAILLLLLEMIGLAAYFVEKTIDINLSISLGSYIFAEILLLIIVRRLAIYDVEATAIASVTKKGDEGFICFDKRFKYLGSVGIASTVYPELKQTQIDKKARKSPFLSQEFLPMLEEFKEKGRVSRRDIKRGDTIYQLTLDPLLSGKQYSGYQFHLVDDTWDRKQIQILNKFGDYLQDKVTEKTKHIQEMHDNLILSMATMVESRDNSTGGHIRRTSDCVRILIDEMKKDPDCEIAKNEKFCQNLVKAAPMHDLGKIAVPDRILQKPGRFTDEEFEAMKAHASEGARIVHEILKGTDDHDFHILAENVAHYHHERMDGSGYPKGLAGEEIPIEARIMAIADVYDALVSKRVYKERMSFEKADSIIMESFEKNHFDPDLEKYYVAARPKLEEYYRENGD